MSIGTGGEIVVANQIRPRVPGERSTISKIIDRIRSMVSRGGAWVSPLIAAHGWQDPRWWSDDLTDCPPVVTELSALGLPPFGRGVELIASTIAGVDLAAFKWDATNQIDVKLSPQPALLTDPDPLLTPWNWKYGMVNDLIMYGNTFAFLGDPGPNGWPLWVEPISIERVDIGIDQDINSPQYGRIVWRIDGAYEYPYGSLFHASAGNRSGYVLGRGVLQQYRDSLSGVLSTTEHAGRYFRRGGMPSAVIKVNDPDLSPETAEEIKDKYEQNVGGYRRRPMVIPGHYEFTPIVSDAEKQQLVEARQWDAQLVAMILGIPAHYLGLPGTSMTYQNIEQADIAFVRDTVDRWAKPLEAAVTKWLLPRGQTVKFEWTDRMRTDAKTRAEILKLEIEAGVTTIDEGRRMMDRAPLPPEPDPPAPPPPPALEPPALPDNQDQTNPEGDQ